MKTIYTIIIVLLCMASLLLIEACQGKDNTQIALDENTWDTIYLEQVDIVDFADTCACDTITYEECQNNITD